MSMQRIKAYFRKMRLIIILFILICESQSQSFCQTNKDCDWSDYCDLVIHMCEGCAWLCDGARTMLTRCALECQGYLSRLHSTTSSSHSVQTSEAAMPYIVHQTSGQGGVKMKYGLIMTTVLIIVIILLITVIITLICRNNNSKMLLLSICKKKAVPPRDGVTQTSEQSPMLDSHQTEIFCSFDQSSVSMQKAAFDLKQNINSSNCKCKGNEVPILQRSESSFKILQSKSVDACGQNKSQGQDSVMVKLKTSIEESRNLSHKSCSKSYDTKGRDVNHVKPNEKDTNNSSRHRKDHASSSYTDNMKNNETETGDEDETEIKDLPSSHLCQIYEQDEGIYSSSVSLCPQKQLNASVNQPDVIPRKHDDNRTEQFVRNKPIYDMLRRFPWIDGYYSEGRSIQIYVDLLNLTPEWVMRELTERTGQSEDKFNIQHKTEQE